jgi:hypothetical protein
MDLTTILKKIHSDGFSDSIKTSFLAMDLTTILKKIHGDGFSDNIKKDRQR